MKNSISAPPANFLLIGMRDVLPVGNYETLVDGDSRHVIDLGQKAIIATVMTPLAESLIVDGVRTYISEEMDRAVEAVERADDLPTGVKALYRRRDELEALAQHYGLDFEKVLSGEDE